MNPYASGQELQVLLGQSALNPERAQAITDQVAALVDAALTAAGYTTVPAIGPHDVLLIGPFVIEMAGVIAHRELYREQEEPARITGWERRFEAFLTALHNGSLRLQDQATHSGGGLQVGYIHYVPGYSSDQGGW
jgi:hypothetical protein